MEPKLTEKRNEWQPDNIDLTWRVMEDTFIPLFLDEQACQKIGFTHISRLIGETPGWYLWTKEQRGAYLLELIDIEYFHNEPGIVDIPKPIINPEVKAEFIVRYYPSPDEPSFDDFAFIEREVRLGPSFDHTGTPLFDKQNEIHESLFTVGRFHLAFDKGLSLALLTISSQDRWIEIVKKGPLVKTDHRQVMEVIPEEVKTRNVPGWELSWYLFDKLLLSFCYVHKSIPFGLGLTEYPGTTYHISEFNQVVDAHEPDVHGRTIEAGVLMRSILPLPIDSRGLKEAFWESIRLSLKKDEVLVEYFENPPEEGCPWINPNWWIASSWSFPPPNEIHHCCFGDH
jgi:hypothetical protein